MKITAFVGSARKMHTYNTVELFFDKLRYYGDFEYEIVRLSDYNLKSCKGCKLCLDKGEELCPLEDDRDSIIDKMIHSDGVIFASPNYSFQVSALMKLFLDRLGYYFHRPFFFGKTFTSIVTQGIYGGRDIVKYLNSIGSGLGFNVVKGSCIRSLEPMTKKGICKIERKIEIQANRFHTQLIKNEFPTPSLLDLMKFRMSRTSMNLMLNDNFRDYTYFTEKGFFKSEYFYPVKLNLLKKLSGKLFDMIAVKMVNVR